MAVQEDLNAIFAAENGVSPVLDDIASDAIEAASGLEILETAADAAEGALDAVERSAASAVPTLEAAEAQIEGVGDEAIRSTAKVEALDASLDGLDTAAFADLPEVHETDIRADINDASVLAASARLDTLTRDRTVDISTDIDSVGGLDTPGGRTVSIAADVDNSSFTAAHAAVASLPHEHTVDVAADIDHDSFSIPQLASRSVPFAAGGLSAPDVSPDSQTVPFEAGGMQLPDLSALQFPATDGGDELLALGGAGHVAAEGLDDASESAIEASAASALAASEASEAGDGFLSVVPGGEAAANVIDGVRSSAVQTIPGLSAAENAVDEYGDEASEAAAETAALQASMAGLGGSGVGTELLGFHGSLSSIATILPLVISLAGGLVAPLGAIATAAGGAGTALTAMVGAGLLAQGEELVGTYQEVDGELKRIESSGEGAKVVLGNIKDRAADVFSELQTAQTADFFSGIVESGFTVLEDFVSFTNRQMDDLSAMGDRLGEAFAIEEPRFFAELEATTRELLPALEAAGVWLLGAIPDGMKWMREEGLDTASALADVAGSALDLGVELAEVGGTVWQTVGPALTFLLGTTADLVGVFTDLPEPVQTFLAATAVAYPVLSALASGIAAVSAAGGVLAVVMGAISWPILAVAGAVGLAIAVMSEWDTIVQVLGQSWNWLVGVIESGANGILSFIGGMVNSAIGFINGLIDAMNKIPGIDIGKVGKVDMGQVDLSGFKAGQNDGPGEGSNGGSGGDGGDPGPGPGGPSQPPSPAGASAGGTGAYAGSSDGGGDSGLTDQSKTEINIYATDEQIQNEAKFKRLAREAVREYNDNRRQAAGG